MNIHFQSKKISSYSLSEFLAQSEDTIQKKEICAFLPVPKNMILLSLDDSSFHVNLITYSTQANAPNQIKSLILSFSLAGTHINFYYDFVCIIPIILHK